MSLFVRLPKLTRVLKKIYKKNEKYTYYRENYKLYENQSIKKRKKIKNSFQKHIKENIFAILMFCVHWRKSVRVSTKAIFIFYFSLSVRSISIEFILSTKFFQTDCQCFYRMSDRFQSVISSRKRNRTDWRCFFAVQSFWSLPRKTEILQKVYFAKKKFFSSVILLPTACQTYLLRVL